MNFIVKYKNILNDIITVDLFCESCCISKHSDGRSYLVFKNGPDIVDAFIFSSVVSCVLSLEV